MEISIHARVHAGLHAGVLTRVCAGVCAMVCASVHVGIRKISTYLRYPTFGCPIMLTDTYSVLFSS